MDGAGRADDPHRELRLQALRPPEEKGLHRLPGAPRPARQAGEPGDRQVSVARRDLHVARSATPRNSVRTAGTAPGTPPGRSPGTTAGRTRGAEARQINHFDG